MMDVGRHGPADLERWEDADVEEGDTKWSTVNRHKSEGKTLW